MKTVRIIAGVLMVGFALVVLALGILQSVTEHVTEETAKDLIK